MRAGVEAKALFELELRIPIPRQAQRGEPKAHRNEKGRLHPNGGRERIVNLREHAAEQKGRKHDRIKKHLNTVETIFGKCVSDGFFVCRQIDNVPKARGNVPCMREHMPSVQPRQIHLGRELHSDQCDHQPHEFNVTAVLCFEHIGKMCLP